MNKSRVNYWVDVFLGISFVICFFTGMLKWPGAYKIVGTSIYQILPMRNLSRLHDWSGLIMALLVFVHLVLHWGWIVCMTKSLFKN
jgi:hypothetical protein